MSQFVIPTRTDLDNYTETVDLDGESFTLAFRWNFRSAAWYLSISNVDGPIVQGIRITVGTSLLHYVGHADKPPGVLMAVDTAGTDIDPGKTELGDRVKLMYTATTE